jgi:DNA replication licensing factor MCM5
MGEDTQATIPITVRQLEALVRLSESLAKMRLDTEVQLEDIQEALRLFTVSTMAANSVDSKEGGGGSMFGSNPSQMEYTESFLNARLNKGTMVNRQRLLEEAASQGHNAVLVAQAIHAMVGRGDLQERNQGRLIKRVR